MKILISNTGTIGFRKLSYSVAGFSDSVGVSSNAVGVSSNAVGI